VKPAKLTKRLRKLLSMAAISESSLNGWLWRVSKGFQAESTSTTAKCNECFPFSNQGYLGFVLFGVLYFSFFPRWSSSFRAPDTQTPPEHVLLGKKAPHLIAGRLSGTDLQNKKLNLRCQ